MRLLVVAGFGSSGEVELARSLAAHPAIVLGVHRYRELWESRLDELSPVLFERERFLSFDDGLTQLTPADPRWREHYDAMAASWGTAEYVGDMTTEVRPMQTWERLPDATFAFIVRDPVLTALARAARAKDPEEAARRSVDGWNRAATRIRRAARERPDRVRILEHDRFLSDPEGTSLNTLLRFLDLEDTPGSDDAFGAAHRRWAAEAQPASAPVDRAHLEAAADETLWRDLLDLAI